MAFITSSWRGLQQWMDAIVDQQFSEPVEFHPWVGGADDATGTSARPDPDRAVLYTTAVYVVPGARATGEGGSRAAGMAIAAVTSEEWISITGEKLGDPSSWIARDRVYLPERNSWHEISNVVPSATDRYNVNLVRLSAGDL
jgi:hypothetical protein